METPYHVNFAFAHNLQPVMASEIIVNADFAFQNRVGYNDEFVYAFHRSAEDTLPSALAARRVFLRLRRCVNDTRAWALYSACAMTETNCAPRVATRSPSWQHMSADLIRSTFEWLPVTDLVRAAGTCRAAHRAVWCDEASRAFLARVTRYLDSADTSVYLRDFTELAREFAVRAVTPWRVPLWPWPQRDAAPDSPSTPESSAAASLQALQRHLEQRFTPAEHRTLWSAHARTRASTRELARVSNNHIDGVVALDRVMCYSARARVHVRGADLDARTNFAGVLLDANAKFVVTRSEVKRDTLVCVACVSDGHVFQEKPRFSFSRQRRYAYDNLVLVDAGSGCHMFHEYAAYHMPYARDPHDAAGERDMGSASVGVWHDQIARVHGRYVTLHDNARAWYSDHARVTELFPDAAPREILTCGHIAMFTATACNGTIAYAISDMRKHTVAVHGSITGAWRGVESRRVHYTQPEAARVTGHNHALRNTYARPRVNVNTHRVSARRELDARPQRLDALTARGYVCDVSSIGGRVVTGA